MTPFSIVGGLVAAGLIVIGVVALFAPHSMARAYGLALEGHAAAGFARATGIRDVAIGAILAAAISYRDIPLIVVLSIAGIVLSITDFAIAYHAGGKRLRSEHGVHLAGVVAFVLVLAMALFAIGF